MTGVFSSDSQPTAEREREPLPLTPTGGSRRHQVNIYSFSFLQKIGSVSLADSVAGSGSILVCVKEASKSKNNTSVIIIVAREHAWL